MNYEVNKNESVDLQGVGNKETPFYQINIYNDDFTPMEYVAKVLEKFFYMNRRQAIMVMLEAHVHGKAKCGLYTKEIAESKIMEIHENARLHEYPLLCGMEVAL